MKDWADFKQKFKEELDILYQSYAAKYDKDCSNYSQGQMDALDRIETLFDKIWKEEDK